MSRKGWIGVDLDGTVARYDGWLGPLHIGEPILPMVERIQAWLASGYCVKIFTARVSPRYTQGVDVSDIEQAIAAWTLLHVGVALPATCIKDYDMVQYWDDRAVRVLENTGNPCCIE